MKQILITILSLIIGLAAKSQKDSVFGARYYLTGKIKDNVQLTPHCGFIAWGTVVNFEVISINGLTYSNKNIGIIITCPEFYKDGFFEKGKTYQVVFSNKNQASFGWKILNKNLLKINDLSFDPYTTSIKKM